MNTEITIDLSDYLDVQEYYEKNFDTVISDLAEYVKEMEKNLYFYSRKEFKSYEEIYNDSRRIVEENK